jgi:hypothetical protein
MSAAGSAMMKASTPKMCQPMNERPLRCAMNAGSSY